MNNINVLIACEESQTECIAFRNLGFNAFSCDIQECSGGHPEWHIKGDVVSILSPVSILNNAGGIHFQTCDKKYHFVEKWDLIIGHPPCTYMTKCGARWMFPKSGQVDLERYDKAMKAKEFLYTIANSECEFIAIENPVPLKIVGLPQPTQKIQPYEYGEPYSKCTCLWLKNLPLLVSTNILDIYIYHGFVVIHQNLQKAREGAEEWLRIKNKQANHLKALLRLWLSSGANMFGIKNMEDQNENL